MGPSTFPDRPTLTHRERPLSIESYIRTVPDYPKEGILFRDVTGLLEHADGLRLANGFTRRGDRIEGAVSDVVAEVPQLLDAIGQAGAGVASLRIETPGLADVFSALTGRELRE